MPALQKFNRGVHTKNRDSWPSAASAMQGVRQRKVMAMNGLASVGKQLSKSTGRMTGVRLPSPQQKKRKGY